MVSGLASRMIDKPLKILMTPFLLMPLEMEIQIMSGEMDAKAKAQLRRDQTLQMNNFSGLPMGEMKTQHKCYTDTGWKIVQNTRILTLSSEQLHGCEILDG